LWQTGCGKNFLYSKEKVFQEQKAKPYTTNVLTLGNMETSKGKVLLDRHRSGYSSDKWQTQLHGENR
jgi:hypothetical protein